MAKSNGSDSRNKNVLRRHAREREPLPSAEIKIRPPKQLPQPPGKPNLLTMLPMIFMALSTGVIGYFVSGGRAIYTAIPMMMMGVIMISVQLWSYRTALKKHAEEVQNSEAKYRGHLDRVRDDLESHAGEQQRILRKENPSVNELIKRVTKRERTVWERQPNDNDFLALRLGTGALPISVTIKPPEFDDEEPRLKPALQLADEFACVDHLPVTTNLNELGSIGVRGQKPSESLYMAFTMVANIVTHHSPDEALLYVLSHRFDAAERWGWLRWLPHTAVLRGDQTTRLSFASGTETEESVLLELSQLLRRRSEERRQSTRGYRQPHPHIVVIFDQTPGLQGHNVMGMLLAHTPDHDENALQASVIFVENPIPPQVNAMVTVRGNELDYRETWSSDANQVHRRGKVEFANPKQVEQLARKMAPLRTEANYNSGGGRLPGSVRLVELLGATQPDNVDLSRLYSEKYEPKKVMAFPVGLNVDLKPQMVILREAGEKGYGSHAILAGMQGQGKSILLQAMVLSMALTHSPKYLNFVLADFKGEGELAKLQDLPHVVGIVTDLLEPAAVERFRQALVSELDKRNRLFASLDRPVTKLRAYNERCPDEPLPHLVIVLDEFARGLDVNNKLRPTMDRIAAQGRALGVHLILSTQRAADFDNKIRPNIDIRMSLRVSSKEDSKLMFNRDEAFTKLARPGQAYIQVGDNEIFEMFQAARADTPYQPEGTANLDLLDEFAVRQLGPDGRRQLLYQHKAGEKGDQKENRGTAVSEAEILINHIRQYCREKYAQARIICLSPLPQARNLPLLSLIPDHLAYRRWQISGWSEDANQSKRLRVPVGKLDLPAQQDQRPFILDLNQRDGNFMVIGPAGSGKALFLRSLVLGLAATHTPDDLHFYFLSRGPTLSIFEDLPHCGAVVRSAETERITRLLMFLREEVRRRQELMRQAKEDSMLALRSAQSDISLPALVIIFDDFAGFKANHESKLSQVKSLARDGKLVDIHLVFSSATISAIHMEMQPGVDNRLALGLKSPADYLGVLEKRAEMLPEILGRGYVVIEKAAFECQIASPASREEITPGTRQETEEIRSLVEAMDRAWMGKLPFPINELAKEIDLASLWQSAIGPPKARELLTAPIGVEYERLSPVSIDLNQLESFILVVGPPGSGKTEFVLSLCLATAANLSPAQIEIFVFAFRHNSRLRMLQALPQVQYSSNSIQAKKHLTELVANLQKRRAGYRTRQESFDGQTDPLANSQPKRTLILIDDLQTFMRGSDMLTKLVDQCAEQGEEVGINLILTDSGHNLNRAKQNHAVQFVQSACRYGRGIAFSVDPNDLAHLGLQYKIKQPVLRLHAPRIGKGRGFLAYQSHETVVQFARVGLENESEDSRHERVKRLAQQIAARYESQTVATDNSESNGREKE